MKISLSSFITLPPLTHLFWSLEVHLFSKWVELTNWELKALLPIQTLSQFLWSISKRNQYFGSSYMKIMSDLITTWSKIKVLRPLTHLYFQVKATSNIRC